MPFETLYVKVICSICKGTRSLYGTKKPPPPTGANRWTFCSYCDHDGLVLIEAGDYTIIQHLMELPKERRDNIIAEIQKIPQ